MVAEVEVVGAVAVMEAGGIVGVAAVGTMGTTGQRVAIGERMGVVTTADVATITMGMAGAGIISDMPHNQHTSSHLRLIPRQLPVQPTNRQSWW